MTASVLRVADQAAGRFPDRCVLTGVPTTHAVRLRAPQWGGPGWMLGVPGSVVALRLVGRARQTVALPVSERVWKMWRRRDQTSIAVMTAGVTFGGIGLATAVTQLAVFGAVVFGAGMAYRTRAHHNYWVTCRFSPVKQTILVEPTHARFDEQARDLFVRPFDPSPRRATG